MTCSAGTMSAARAAASTPARATSLHRAAAARASPAARAPAPAPASTTSHCGLAGARPAPRRAARGGPANAAAVSWDVDVNVDPKGPNTRELFASITIAAPPDLIWDCLTDYENLADFIPSLETNKLMERFPGGCKLYQVGAQDVALGAKFRAKALVECREYPAGLRGDGARLGFPQPRGTVWGRKSSDITFKMIEGDFRVFKGMWNIQNGRMPGTSRLSYAVTVTPQLWLPVALVQGRIAGEIEANLKAVRSHAERLQTVRST
ncbi:unnamed protein product [Pedinophyceae sp. YPF-701]|nr:unnamed protein product [Pedinophyceae sp. YPF-701]